MIRLRSERSAQTVHRNFHGAKRQKNAEALIRRQLKILRGEKAKKFNSSVWKASKSQLFEEAGDKCAYCESPTKVNAHGDVEHFRPKSIYWWLAYALDNFLVACAVCNQSFKGNKFPVAGNRWAGPNLAIEGDDAEIVRQYKENLFPDPLSRSAVDAFIKRQTKEKGALINPYYEDPKDFLAYKAIAFPDGTGIVRIVPTHHPLANQKVAAAEEVYGLNRHELMEQRWTIYCTYEALRAVVDSGALKGLLLERVKDEISDMQSLTAPYAGMIRFFERKGGPDTVRVRTH